MSDARNLLSGLDAGAANDIRQRLGQVEDTLNNQVLPRTSATPDDTTDPTAPDSTATGGALQAAEVYQMTSAGAISPAGSGTLPLDSIYFNNLGITLVDNGISITEDGWYFVHIAIQCDGSPSSGYVTMVFGNNNEIISYLYPGWNDGYPTLTAGQIVPLLVSDNPHGIILNNQTDESVVGMVWSFSIIKVG